MQHLRRGIYCDIAFLPVVGKTPERRGRKNGQKEKTDRKKKENLYGAFGEFVSPADLLEVFDYFWAIAELDDCGVGRLRSWMIAELGDSRPSNFGCFVQKA